MALTYQVRRERRTLASLTTSLGRVSRALTLASLIFGGAAGQGAAVAPADLSRLSPADFRDDELDLPYYLAHFSRVANSVALSGPRRGFIDLAVWRSAQDNQPHNARIMESILSLAFFYATDRPWNPYRGDPAVRARLEAALDFWTREQSEDGRFSEYAPERWSLAPTAFATKFMGETLRLLHQGPPIDPALYRRVVEADRRALVAVLTIPDLYEHGRRFSNQYSNVWAGALAYIALYPDTGMERELRARLRQAVGDHQSPAGYFYEADGPDWGYDVSTHHSGFFMAWRYARGTDLAGEFIEPLRRWYEWLGYNAVPEPGESALTLNRAIETRQRRSVVAEAGPAEAETGNPLSAELVAARMLGPTQEELLRRHAQQRTELARHWPHVEPLAVGTFRAFSPYAFLHRSDPRWYPTEVERRTAVTALRHQTDVRFTHQRTDARKPIVFSFVRRPAYYAAFTTGETTTAQQRYGLGLLWIPGTGSVLQSQTAGLGTAWGTRVADTNVVYEATTFAGTFRVRDSVVAPAVGNRDLPGGDYRIDYPLGARGMKTVVFGERGLHVAVEHPGNFVEQLPLLVLPADAFVARPGRIELSRGPARLAVRWTPVTSPTVDSTDQRSGARGVLAVAIPATGALTYDVDVLGAGGSR